MADNNKKKYIKYEDTTYILEDSRLPDPTGFDNKVLGVDNGAYVIRDEQGGGGGTGTVKSVNNVQPDANGNVNLSASDVHALPDSTVIPTVPQMATQTDMSDWSSGKTVDAAVLAQDFASVLTSLGDLADEVDGKADTGDLAPVATSGSYDDLTDKPSIPSLSGYATEQWVWQQGYQTAQQVQTAIAAIPDELPSGGSAGDFLRKTASGAAWQTVPSAESNSFGGGS